MQTKKSIGIVGTAMAALAGAIGAGDRELELSEPMQAKPTPVKSRKKAWPNKAELKAMTPEKRDYWNRKMSDSAVPAWWRKPAQAQFRAGASKPVLPDPLTRQLRRQQARTEFRQPIHMSGAEWESRVKAQRKANRNAA